MTVSPSIGRAGRWRLGAAALIAAAALATVASAVEPDARLAARNVAVQASYETAAAFVALLVAYLLAGRYGRTRGRRDLVLACGVSVLALSNLLFTAVPNMAGARDAAFAVWASTLGTLTAASALAAGAMMSNHPLGRPRRAGGLAALAALAAVAAIALAVGLLDARLPNGIDPALSPQDSPLVTGRTGLLALHAAAAVAYALAAVGFMRRSRGDELLRWFALATMLAAFARVNYFLLPSSLSSWLSTGDLLRMAFYLVLLAGAAREIRAYQRSVAIMARTEERRRFVRDLHDGLAQELAFIATASARLASRDSSARELDMLGAASRRAMDESRMLIETLAADPAPLRDALARAAGEVAERAGIGLEVRVAPDVEVDPRTQEALARIVREAANNAARHGGAGTIRLEVTAAGALRVRIADDGRGFDTAGAATGFGLVSMRERAEAVGGRLEVRSRPGEGTEVEVEIP